VVRRARHVRDYVLEFAFSDGSTREIDLQPYLRGPIFEPWTDPEAFRRFNVRYGSIVWPNGAGIAPETLHEGLSPTELVPHVAKAGSPGPRRRKRRKEPEWVVKRVRHVRDYVVELAFADGLTREVDIKPFMHGQIWRGWEAPDKFTRVRVEYGTLVWPGGPDIAPETLYYDLGPVSPQGSVSPDPHQA
jgi:Protein of unknown function (DUF2442)